MEFSNYKNKTIASIAITFVNVRMLSSPKNMFGDLTLSPVPPSLQLTTKDMRATARLHFYAQHFGIDISPQTTCKG